MAEEENISSLIDQDGTNTSQPKDVYVPEEPTQDVSLSDIQMPETPESTKGQVSDGDTSRLESPKMVKPVLGKVQAKKRLMAFANKFKVLLKPQVKSNLSQHSTGALKMKDKAAQDDTNANKSKKKTEEKILAIEEIRREESKSKMLLAEAMAAANMEEEHHGKTISGLLENTKLVKERSKHEGTSVSHKSRSTIERKYTEKQRHRDKTDQDNAIQEIKERSTSIERSTRKSQDREKYKKDKRRKDNRDRRDRMDSSRDKRDEGKDRKENEKEKREETREKKESIKNKKEHIKDKRNDTMEVETESKDKKDKNKDRWREKELIKCNSWAELRKSGLTIDDIIQFRKRDNFERTMKNRTAQDFARHFEQMLMLNNYHLKRQAVIAEGLDGPRKYPPESIKITKRAKGSQLLYCENPNVSLLLRVPQLLEVVTPERRERIRDICEASSLRIDMEDAEDTEQQSRNWYQQINLLKYHKDAKWQVSIQLPKSKWDSEDEEASSNSVIKEEIERTANKLHVSLNQQERCSTSSSITDEDKTNENVEEVKEDHESIEETISNTTTNDKVPASPLLQSAGDEKLASEYEQFMKMVCTDIPLPTAADVTKEYSPKKNAVNTASPHTYHEFNIESNSMEDNANIEITLKKFEKTEKLQTLRGSMKSTEEESTPSDGQVQIAENNMQVKHTNNNPESEDSKSIPSDWENVRIKVERLSDENTEPREVKKKNKRRKVISSSDSSSSTSSSDSEREKKKKHKRILSNSSSSDSDSTDTSSSSSSSDSSSSDEKRKRKRKKKKADKKRKKARRAARTKKKRRRRMNTDSSSSDSDERRRKKRRIKKKKKEAKQFDIKPINNEDMSTMTSPVMSSPSDETKILHSTTPIKKVKEEAIAEDKTRTDQVTSTRSIAGINVHGTECINLRSERKEDKSNKFLEEWEIDSMIPTQQNDSDTSSHTELEKIDSLEKDKYRRKRKHGRDNDEQDKHRSPKVNEEKVHRGKERSDDELETKKKKRKEKDVRSSTEFLADWERESERIAQQIIQNEIKFSKKTGKQKKEIWGETDFNTLNVPSLTQLEEVCEKQLLADEWEVDSLEALSDLGLNKRKSTLKKIEKEVRYDKKTDTYIAIEKERARELRKRQERLCAIRIWEEEQEEGEKEEMMLLQEKKKHKKDDWDIEEESFLRQNEEIEISKMIEKDWSKLSESMNVKEDSNMLTMKLEPVASKRIKKSRWDMGSQSEEKSDAKDIWEEEYAEWSKNNKCEQKLEETESRAAEYSENSAKSDLIEFHHKKLQNRESLEKSWTSEETATKSMQAKKIEDVSNIKNLISTETDKEQIVSAEKELQNADQFKDILGLDAKFKEKVIELYSPSSPALSQKSQDAEISNDSNLSNSNSLSREKKRKEISITTKELSIPTDGIPLQLMKLRDTKHPLNENENFENILDKGHLENKGSVYKFDLKDSDNLFVDSSSSEICSEKHNTQSIGMDIFAEYESEQSRSKHATTSNIRSETHVKDDEAKTALKLIPKQLLIRRTNEQVSKPKRILEVPLQDPDQHAATLLSIQKKLLESNAFKNDIKKSSNEESIDHKLRYNTSSETDKLLDTTEFAVTSKSSLIMSEGQSRSPVSEKICSSIQSEQSESYNKESKNDDVKRYKSSRNLSDSNILSSIRSPVREQRRRSPNRKESEKRYSHDYSKDKKDRKSDDAEKSDRRDNRSSKTDVIDSRRKSSPSGRGRKKRSRSPYISWERQRSGSKSPGHSWSRSHSRSPKRKDETNMRNKEKKRERYDERSGRSRTDERREQYARSPRFSYNEDNFKKHGSISFKGNRDDWNRKRHDDIIDRDREQDVKSYDSDVLRDRTTESESYRDNRFHAEGETDRAFWQFEGTNILRDGNESIDSYAAGQDLPLEYDDRAYYREGSPERLQSSPQHSSRYRRSQRSSSRRERQWEKDKDTVDLDRHGHHAHRSRNRSRSKHSPTRQIERFRRKSRSRSRSWSRSSSRSRSTSRSRPRMRSRSRSNSKSPSNQKSRARSTSLSRLRSPEHGLRLSELRSSRSPSPGRGRLNEIGRERKDEDENRKLNVYGERGRRIETIVQSGVTSGVSNLNSEMGLNSSMDATIASFQYSNEIEGGNEYYYTENNLTYPPCIDDSTTSSPKRLSLDDRLEIELGIKKQHSKDSTSSEYSSNFNPNVVVYPSPPQQHQMVYRQQPTVLQVGNVLQVVPADFNGIQSARREASTAATPPARAGSNQVVRVGNVLQVVPTSLDWSADQSSSTADQSSRVLYSSSAVPALSPVPSAHISVPVPVPVPLPVPPAVPTVTNNIASIATMSPVAPLPLSLPVPVPMPVPIPATATTFPRNEVQPQKVVQPVYNYEAILEIRHKEQEERKRLRKKEKERKRIERTNRRALRLLEKSTLARQAGSTSSLDHHKGSIVDPLVLKALREGEEQAETESQSNNPVKEEEEIAPIKEGDEDAAADQDEDEDEDEAEVEAETEVEAEAEAEAEVEAEVEMEAEDDEDEEEEAEDEDEDDDDDDEKPRVIHRRMEIDMTDETLIDANKNLAEIEIKKEWPELPPPPLKGILIAPGFRRDISNGDSDNLSDTNDDKIGNDKDEEADKNNECDKDAESDILKPSKLRLARLLNKMKKSKKSVQFADGIKPGEGTSPSGGEGDMPSPPPPTEINFREGLKDLRRDKIYSSRKRKEKRAKPLKAKKKVKVKIIKVKKPCVNPLTAMMMDDFDEMDDRSPPPPPPGSPPPPHLWPSYLSPYNIAVRTVEQPQATTSTSIPVQVPPPPTPLPLLIRPPPLNYTIQPCSKA